MLLVDGEVEQAGSSFALPRADRADGWILACVGAPAGDCVIDVSAGPDGMALTEEEFLAGDAAGTFVTEVAEITRLTRDVRGPREIGSGCPARSGQLKVRLSHRPIIMTAGGSGLAPIESMAADLAARRQRQGRAVHDAQRHGPVIGSLSHSTGPAGELLICRCFSRSWT